MKPPVFNIIQNQTRVMHQFTTGRNISYIILQFFSKTCFFKKIKTKDLLNVSAINSPKAGLHLFPPLSSKSQKGSFMLYRSNNHFLKNIVYATFVRESRS